MRVAVTEVAGEVVTEAGGAVVPAGMAVAGTAH